MKIRPLPAQGDLAEPKLSGAGARFLRYGCNYRKVLYAMLANRDAVGALAAWHGLEHLLPFHATIAPIAVFYMGWPNTLFVPEDPALALFAEPDPYSIQGAGLLCAIDQALKIKDCEYVGGMRLDEINLSYREWLESIAGEVGRNGHPVAPAVAPLVQPAGAPCRSIPLVGRFLNGRLLRWSIWRQLDGRAAASVISRWTGLGDLLPLHGVFAGVACLNLSWPNGLFIPEDPMCCLMPDATHLSGRKASKRVLRDLRWQLRWPADLPLIGDALDAGLYGDFLTRLSRRVSTRA